MDLRLEESATLVGMLKATYAYNPRLFPENSLRRRNLVLRAMAINDYLSEEDADSIAQLPLNLNYREYDYNSGMAPYFREEVRKQLLKWNKQQKQNGIDHNIYTSGLKIYTTLDYSMQALAEKVMAAHMKSLQADFEKSHGKNPPWNSNKKLIEKTVRNSPVYKKLIENGLNNDHAWDSLSVKKTMTLTSWEGDKTVSASTIDSIVHYMKFLNTGSLAMDPNTGGVKVWIGGVNYKYFKYDHISQSKRQVGSAFKPIVYTAALEKGIDPCTYFSAEEVAYENLEGWSPGNSGDKDEAYLNYSMEEALSNSINTVAVKVLEQTGIPKVLEQAGKMGITTRLPEQPSLALGTGEIGIEELAGAYASFVNDRKPVHPYVIERIADEKDSVLAVFERKNTGDPAFSEENRQVMIEMMKATIDNGTASRIRTTYGLRNDIAGKTGTTQNNKDAWFVGLTPNLLHITWVGLDNHEIGFRSTQLGQGANAALPLFALLMQELNRDPSYDHITKARFKAPDEAVLEKLDCEPVKRDGFFKRLFKNPNKKKTRKFQDRN
jgi:penicillin-binding protein 1A